MNEEDMMKYINALSKKVEILLNEVQILRQENLTLKDNIMALNASNALSKGVGVTNNTRDIVNKKCCKNEDDAIHHFELMAEVFGNTWDEPDNINKQR